MNRRERLRSLWIVLTAGVVLAAPLGLKAQSGASQIEDITGEYQFLSPQDTLAILQEDTMLKGYIDVYQGESESDAILSYPITIGSCNGDHVEFKTRRIHEKYYRFSGTAKRGEGSKVGDPDYTELVGNLQIITVARADGKESAETRQVVFKSKGKAEQQQ